MRLIVTTKPDGSVAVTAPTAEIMHILTCGGAPAGYFGRALDRDWEVHKLMAAGCREAVAVRWIDHLIGGGLTDAEAYELVADKDVPSDWTARELVDAATLRHDNDRWFRDAWRRSRNGGPIDVDMPTARRIQAQRIVEAKSAALASLGEQGEISLIADGGDMGELSMIERIRSLDLVALSRRVRAARHPAELKTVWPQDLPAGRAG